MEYSFRTLIGAADWDAGASAWRCPMLGIPGVQVAEVFVDGIELAISAMNYPAASCGVSQPFEQLCGRSKLRGMNP